MMRTVGVLFSSANIPEAEQQIRSMWFAEPRCRQNNYYLLELHGRHCSKCQFTEQSDGLRWFNNSCIVGECTDAVIWFAVDFFLAAAAAAAADTQCMLAVWGRQWTRPGALISRRCRSVAETETAAAAARIKMPMGEKITAAATSATSAS